LGSGPDGVKEIFKHPFFKGLDWTSLRNQRPPYMPRIDSPTDTRYTHLNIRRMKRN